MTDRSTSDNDAAQENPVLRQTAIQEALANFLVRFSGRERPLRLDPRAIRLATTKVGLQFVAVIQVIADDYIDVGKPQNGVLLCDFFARTPRIKCGNHGVKRCGTFTILPSRDVLGIPIWERTGHRRRQIMRPATELSRHAV
jgi:hypothetical protein